VEAIQRLRDQGFFNDASVGRIGGSDEKKAGESRQQFHDEDSW
jgi:hypothetical protein